MATSAQRSFSGGELSPALHARVDLVKYATGLKTCRNAFVMKSGGAANRPGTTFIGEVKDSTQAQRLIPFIFNASQAYVVQISSNGSTGFIRFIKNGAQILEAAKTISGVTNANPGVVTCTAHGYTDGDEIAISGVVGMTQLNNRNFKVYNSTTNTFQLKYMDGVTVVDTTSFGVYSSGGTAGRVYSISCPYMTPDLPDIHFTQSADVMTIVHPNYPPYYLKRLGDTNWTMTPITFVSKMARPTGGTFTSRAGPGSLAYRYRITAVDGETFDESLPGYELSKSITGITNANPAVVTSASHGYQNGNEIYIDSVVGMTQVNSGTYIISGVTTNTFQLTGVDSTSYGVYVSGGNISQTCVAVVAAAPTQSNPNNLTWNAVTGAKQYYVYLDNTGNGVYGLLGIAASNTFSDTGLPPDFTKAPPSDRNLFGSTGNYPSTVTYFQQRQVFGNTTTYPDKVWTSQTGRFTNFSLRTPIRDDDAVTFTMSGRQINEVRHLVDLGDLIILTSGGEHSASGDNSGTLKPSAINAHQHGYSGANKVNPITIANTILYIQARGTIVRDLAYNYQLRGYSGTDLTIYGTHLFNGFTLTDWAYQQNFNSIIWAVRSDGTLLGLTYVKEHEILAWHRHDFAGGIVENVCCIPEGNEDAVYLVVRRTINGRSVRYVERMNSRIPTLVEDYNFNDASLSYDGRNTDTTKTMTISGGTLWDQTETLTLTSNASYFASTDVGNQIKVTGSDGTIIRFTITGYTSGTVVTGSPQKPVPAIMQSVAISTWSKATAKVSGLWHLEGQKVSIYADGFVVASPNNVAYTTYTVTNGSLTLNQPYSVIRVGLPFISDIETLNLDSAQGETMADKNKAIGKVSVQTENTRGLWMGAKPPTNDSIDPLEGLVEVKIRESESYDSPTALTTGTVQQIIQQEWNSNGRVFIRQVDPVPMEILAVFPSGFIPTRGQ